MDVNRKTAMTGVILALVLTAVVLMILREALVAGVVFICATVAIYLREVWA